MKQIFTDVLIARSVYGGICVRGHGLMGGHEPREAVKDGLIVVKDVKDHLLVNALSDPLAVGEAETITLTVEEKADYVVIDDKLVLIRLAMQRHLKLRIRSGVRIGV